MGFRNVLVHGYDLTGFTGRLTLPPATVRALSLPERGFVEVDSAKATS